MRACSAGWSDSSRPSTLHGFAISFGTSRGSVGCGYFCVNSNDTAAPPPKGRKSTDPPRRSSAAEPRQKPKPTLSDSHHSASRLPEQRRPMWSETWRYCEGRSGRSTARSHSSASRTPRTSSGTASSTTTSRVTLIPTAAQVRAARRDAPVCWHPAHESIMHRSTRRCHTNYAAVVPAANRVDVPAAFRSAGSVIC